MRQRRDRLMLGGLAGLVLVVTLGPIIIAVVQIVRDPALQHPDLVLFGAAGVAIDRLLWSLGFAAVVLALRVVVAAINSHRPHERRAAALPDLLLRRTPRT